MVDALILEVRKNAKERLRVSIGEYQGHTLIDSRIYAEDGQEIIATKKGLSLRPELARDLIKGLEMALARLESEGRPHG